MSPQKSKILHLGFYMSIVLALVLLVACGPSAPTPAETPKPTTTGPQKYGGLLRITHTSVPRVLGYPGKNMGNDTKWMAPCVESLIRIGKDLQPEPLLVESWEVAPDGKIITFKLRKGVKFHDGTDFNSDAVKANMDLQLAAKKGTLANLTSVDVIDPYTVRFNLKQWDFTLLYNLGQNEGIMLSPASLKLGEEAVQFKPVGTGPFKLASYENDVKVKYTKFDGYWQKGKPYLDGIEIISIANTNTAINSLKAGEVDLLLGTTQASGKLAQDASMPGVIKIITKGIPIFLGKALRSLSRNRAITRKIIGYTMARYL